MKNNKIKIKINFNLNTIINQNCSHPEHLGIVDGEQTPDTLSLNSSIID